MRRALFQHPARQRVDDQQCERMISSYLPSPERLVDEDIRQKFERVRLVVRKVSEVSMSADLR